MPLLLCIFIGAISAPYFSLQPLMAVSGGIFLLFSGFEINLRNLGAEKSLIGKLWLGAFLPPFVFGLALPYMFPHLFTGPDGIGIQDTAFILGIALAVSAVPVVIKIMHEIGWTGSLRAQRVVFTAVVCDIAAWLLFFLVLPSEGQTPWLLSHWSLLMFFVGLAIAYLWPGFVAKIRLAFKLNQWIVAPIFFIGVGQSLDLSLGVNVPQAILIFVVATISKTAGVWMAAKNAGLPHKEVIALSTVLNARGAMEIIMAKFALAAGVITTDFFTSLVIMAIATSLIIKPIFRWGKWF